MGTKLCPSDSYVEDVVPLAQNMTVFGDRSLKGVIQSI